jgi:hypothetical protein
MRAVWATCNPGINIQWPRSGVPVHAESWTSMAPSGRCQRHRRRRRGRRAHLGADWAGLTWSRRERWVGAVPSSTQILHAVLPITGPDSDLRDGDKKRAASRSATARPGLLGRATILARASTRTRQWVAWVARRNSREDEDAGRVGTNSTWRRRCRALRGSMFPGRKRERREKGNDRRAQ